MDGNYYQTCTTTLKQISLKIHTEGYEINLKHRQDIGGQFSDFWNNLEHAKPKLRYNPDHTNENDTAFTNWTDSWTT